MLEMTAVPRAPTSRLSCQIALDARLDGLAVASARHAVLTFARRADTSRPAQLGRARRADSCGCSRCSPSSARSLAGVLLTVVTLMTCGACSGATSWAPRSSATSSSRAPPRAPRSRSSCRGASTSAATSSSTSSPRRQRGARSPALDRFGALLLGLAMALLAWRTSLGGVNAWKSGSGTMLIGFPEWLIYVGDGAAAGR